MTPIFPIPCGAELLLFLCPHVFVVYFMTILMCMCYWYLVHDTPSMACWWFFVKRFYSNNAGSNYLHLLWLLSQDIFSLGVQQCTHLPQLNRLPWQPKLVTFATCPQGFVLELIIIITSFNISEQQLGKVQDVNLCLFDQRHLCSLY